MAEHIVSRRTYTVICAALLALTLLTWAVAMADLGRLNVAMALAIAFTKAALVALFFMHVRYSSRLTQLVVVASVVWLAILMVLTFSDYITREMFAP